MNLNLIFVLCILPLSVFLYRFIKEPLINICEIEKCPYCFGIDFCSEFRENKLTLRKTSILDLFFNYFSVKNVFYAIYNDSSVVLKKLGHNFQLERLDREICFANNLSNDCDLSKVSDTQNYLIKTINFLSMSNYNEVKHFKICSESASNTFINYLINNTKNTSERNFLKNAWTVLQLNAEPLLLQLLRSENNWPVPYYFGACGRIIVENHCGTSLNDFLYADWNIRAYLALQLVEAAVNFTERHQEFRFYLTDISPDNIAVNSELKITFVDLENAIVSSKEDKGLNIHYSENINAENGFAFSDIEICKSSVSDHNYYAVCKLLLSKDAPWPMVDGGLLHLPSDFIKKTYPSLFKAIEACANQTKQMNCFQAVKIIKSDLKKILSLIM